MRYGLFLLVMVSLVCGAPLFAFSFTTTADTITISAENGYFDWLKRGFTFQLSPDPEDTNRIDPIITGEEDGTPMRFIITADSGSNLEISFSLPDSLVNLSVSSIKTPCSFDSVSVYRANGHERWDPRNPHTIHVSSNAPETVYVGLTVTVLPDLPRIEYSGSISCTVIDPDLQDTTEHQATYYVGLLSPFRFEVGSNDGQVSNLLKGNAYVLSADPNDSISVQPRIGGSEEGYPMEFGVRVDSGDHLRITFTLPDTVRNENIPSDFILCSFDSTGVFMESTTERWNPAVAHTIQLPSGEEHVFYLGINVTLPPVVYASSYTAEVICTIEDLEKQTTKQASAFFNIHVSNPWTFQLTTEEGELSGLHPGNTYTLSPDPTDTLPVRPRITGDEMGTPTSFEVRSDSGDHLQISFVLPATLYNTEMGSSIPCTFDSVSVYFAGTTERWDPHVPHTVQLQSAAGMVYLGITVILPSSPFSGIYEGSIICSVIDTEKQQTKDVVSMITLEYSHPFLVTATDGQLQNLQRGFTYTLDPESLSVTPAFGSETGLPVTFDYDVYGNVQVCVGFLLPAVLVGPSSSSLNCSFSSTSGYLPRENFRFHPDSGVVFITNSEGAERVRLGITVSVPPDAPTGTYSATGYSVSYYCGLKGQRRQVDGIVTPVLFHVYVIGGNAVPEERSIPAEFKLEQNYPNPFNPITVIRYALPVNSYVSLKVYNALGQEVVTLINEKQDTGTYDVEFDGSHVPGGIYFYRLYAGDLMSVKKLLLLK